MALPTDGTEVFVLVAPGSVLVIDLGGQSTAPVAAVPVTGEDAGLDG